MYGSEKKRWYGRVKFGDGQVNERRSSCEVERENKKSERPQIKK